jgi:ATP-dependent Lon protease
VLLPVGNRADWAEVPASAQAKLTVHWVETVDEAMAQAFSTTGMQPVPSVGQANAKGISP